MPTRLLQRLVVTVAVFWSATGIAIRDERTAADVLPTEHRHLRGDSAAGEALEYGIRS